MRKQSFVLENEEFIKNQLCYRICLDVFVAYASIHTNKYINI